ncbi:MAG: hypothetical protein ACTSUE_16225, partial [Promethearchaeota archaeon]
QQFSTIFSPSSFSIVIFARHARACDPGPFDAFKLLFLVTGAMEKDKCTRANSLLDSLWYNFQET